MQKWQKQFLWMQRAAQISSTRKNLSELIEDETLFDESFVDKSCKEYKIISKSFETANKCGYHIITYIDEEYPEALKNLSVPPPQIYVRGNENALSHGLFAGFVGCRECDDYGLNTATRLACELAQTGVGIISGGAKGVDAASHRGAIMAKGCTVSVLGCGVDIDYPSCNSSLFEKIIENGGAVISEYHMGSKPEKWNFPKRNRIIAALSEVVAVIRAGHRSGALITANYANNIGKTIYAVPGNTDNHLSAGTNLLIKDGAVPFLSSIDMLDELIERFPDFFKTEKPAPKEKEKTGRAEVCASKTENKTDRFSSLSPNEREVVDAVLNGHTLQAEIESHISFDPSRLMATLGMLELKGVLVREFDKNYKLQSGGER